MSLSHRPPASDSDDSVPHYRSIHISRNGAASDDGPLQPLVDPKPLFTRCASHPRDELRSFRSWLRWMCIDQTGFWRAALSWIVFLAAAVVVPAVSHFVLSYDDRRRRYDKVVQLSLSALSALAFWFLSTFTRKYGLRRFLLLDRLCSKSERVRLGYTDDINRSFKLLAIIVLPCFAAETAYKIWWYRMGTGQIPFLGNPLASNLVSGALELFSWLYRTSIFFLLCVLFMLVCHLQNLRIQDFSESFGNKSDVGSIYVEHLHIRHHLHVISHRFRRFIVSCLFIVTLFQLAGLLLTTRDHSHDVNLFDAGELALCSVTIVSGLFLCLRSAAKVTHKAQSITSLATKWHLCATIESIACDAETSSPTQVHPDELAYEEESYDDDENMEGSMRIHPFISTISFQKREALVRYLEHNKAGITIFGFTVDRAWLHTIFGLELTLVLWLLGKTIGIS